MKRFSIFRKGKHTASSGTTLDFSEDDLRRAAEVYDPAVSPAPIVVGHPTLNGPAYGWVKALHFNDGTGENEVDPEQVEESFAEMVKAGRFRTRSASWYMPGSAAHPLAGQAGHDAYYLRHVGFLGAAAPAVKGLKAVEFSSSDGVVEFADSARWAWGSMASGLRGLREWVISKFNLEEADKAIPNYLISDIERAAEEARVESTATAGGMPAFSEQDMATVQELQTQLTAAQAQIAALQKTQMPADFAERETALAAREAKVADAEKKTARAAVEARVDAFIKAGKALPAAKKQMVEFAMSLAEGEATIDFGEGDKAKKVTQREAYLLQIEAGPKLVDYSEHSGDNGQGTDSRPPLAEVQADLRNQVFGGGAPAQK